MNDQNRTSRALNDAWDALFESLPARWHIGKPSYDAGHQAWSVTAWGPRRGRQTAPPSVIGIGEDEAAALRDLNDRLRRVPKPSRGRMDELRRRLRMAYLDGAEAVSQENVGRGLTADELWRVIGRYVGP